MSDGKPRKSADPLYLLLREGRAEEFNRRRKAGASCDLRGCDFRGVDLRGVDVASIDFSDCYFRQADLRGLDLPNGGCEPPRSARVRCLLPQQACIGRDRNVGTSRHSNAPEMRLAPSQAV